MAWLDDDLFHEQYQAISRTRGGFWNMNQPQ
jgi:hypothetical protein